MRLGLWESLSRSAQAALDAEAERLTTHRGQTLTVVVEDL